MTENPGGEHRGDAEVSGYRSIVRFLRRNRTVTFGIILLAIILIMAVMGGLLTPYSYRQQIQGSRLLAPGADHLLGTDQFGRDVLSRIIAGARISLFSGFLATLVSTVPGVLLGGLAGFYSRMDDPIMRVMDILMTFPGILLALVVVTVLGSELHNAVIAVGIWGIPTFARVTRGAVLSVKEQGYVESARAIGSNDLRIMGQHILPNCLAPILVLMSMRVGQSILSLAALTFLGLGAAPPTPAWGLMLSEARAYMREAWWMTTFPGLAILITVWGFNLVGDGLRDYLDPYVRSN